MLLDRIVQIFEANKGEYLSGEQLSSQLNCSRTAVWKHIASLREQGYQFESAPRRGYKLIEVPPKLDLSLLLNAMRTRVMGRSVQLMEEVDSTQAAAQSLAVQGAQEGTLVIAEAQTNGRGRMNRKWHSPKGKGIWMSLLLRPLVPLQFAPQLTLLTAVAVCRTLRKSCQIDIGIKWPNDLLVNGRKVCGILLESSAEDERLKHVIAGIGISANLSADDFPEELKGIATSLYLETGEIVQREAIIGAFLDEFEELYQLYHEQGFAPIRVLWEALSVSLHRPIRVRTPQGSLEGIADRIDDRGALIVTHKDGSQTAVYAGDVEI
jgi:BirA family transcriptional regulator, biotin operon repressor / biotin---[acetyl-CoA-carboxylase] ligase